ncbi:MAG: ParA family protein [Synergistaceae bacterium]|nr:ParA family protein [Synergistaceae bacterium]
MIIIGFCNLKGGVGKTTACQNIAAALAKAKRRVAVVDMDPQSNLSAGFGVKPSETDPQVFDLLSGEASWDDIVCTKEGVDIVPSSLNLAMAELNDTSPVNTNTALREALKKVDPDRYEFMLLDSPPQLGIFTRNVLTACSKIVVPMDGGFYSLFGLRLLNNAMPALRERLNPELEILGILMTNYNTRLYIARQVYEEVGKTFGDVLFRNCIRQNISLVEASSMGMSIFQYAPKSKGAECYRDVTDELLAKLGKGRPNRVRTHSPVPTPPAPKPEPPKPEPPKPATVEPPKPQTPPDPPKAPAPMPAIGEYEQGIKQDILDMLPEDRKDMWLQMLAPVTDITRGEIDVRALRDDFEESDKARYTFYVLNDEDDTFMPVMFPDQIIEPLKCVVKWDEYNGSVEAYM